MRLSIWNSTGSRRLEANGAHLEVDVAGGAHAAPAAIVDAVRRQLGIEVVLLRVGAGGVVEVEYLETNRLPGGFAWRAQSMTPSAEERPLWQRPGWLAETLAAIDRELARVALRRTGPPVQVRHTTVTGMLRIPTDRHPVWLKAVAPIFAHEGAVVAWLEDVAAGSVPKVLAHTPSWWLAAPFPARVHSSPQDDFLVHHARIQVAVTSMVDELRAVGCPERPLARLPEEMAHLAARSDLLDPADRESLREAVPRLADVCRDVGALDFRPTLVHGDLHPQNVLWTEQGWFVFDWTDVCIAHPFVDLALPLVYDVEDEERDRRSRAYASTWIGLMGSVAVERALAAAPIIGAAHEAASYRLIVDGTERSGGDQASGEQLINWLRFWVYSLLASLPRYVAPSPRRLRRSRCR